MWLMRANSFFHTPSGRRAQAHRELEVAALGLYHGTRPVDHDGRQGSMVPRVVRVFVQAPHRLALHEMRAILFGSGARFGRRSCVARDARVFERPTRVSGPP